ncbi:hypothetical protein I317_02688 [Kwoniella heveanensis CBS 569]|nr:hypothetical protein I317_02688 [Kwoniella heveanensis CBS 569]
MSRVAPKATSLLKTSTLSRSGLKSTAFALRPARLKVPSTSAAAPILSSGKRYASTETKGPSASSQNTSSPDAGAGPGAGDPASSEQAKVQEGRNGLKISWIFGGLAGLGALVTIYGLLEFYSTLTTWPKAIRKPLRAALKAKLNGDYMRSEKYFREAIDVTLELGPDALETDALLKITGIYVELANVLELMGQRVTAFHDLQKALAMYGADPIERVQPGSSVVTSEWANSGSSSGSGTGYRVAENDRIRVIGLHQKLGQLALEISSSAKAPKYDGSAADGNGVIPSAKKIEDWNAAAEYYLSSALTAMLKLGLSTPQPDRSSGRSGDIAGLTTPNQKQVVLGRDVNLPDGELSEDADQGGRVDKRGLGMTMESLSEVYARKGQYDLSAQLLLQAVSLLLPPGSQDQPPVRDRCQAAMLMTTISSHALRARTQSPLPSSSSSHTKPSSPKEQAIKISKSWSLRSLQLSEQALRDTEGEGYKDSPLEAAVAVCQRARAVGLHNLGMLAEMEGDLPGALNLFNKALTASRETGFKEGKREAAAAIRRVQSLVGGGAGPSS